MTGQPPGSDEAAARLVERVLSDPAFRARFRRDPAGAADEAGLDPVTATAVHPALETLDLRESKSSLAGALMAAAVEGLALYEVVDHGGLGADSAEAAVGAGPARDLAVLHDPNIDLDASGVADLRAGRIDPRIIAVLEQVSKRHQIGVSALLSDHGARTANGSLSNHHFGRAVDIATVDGRPVSPGNEAARKLAAALLRLDPRIRPTEARVAHGTCTMRSRSPTAITRTTSTSRSTTRSSRAERRRSPRGSAPTPPTTRTTLATRTPTTLAMPMLRTTTRTMPRSQTTTMRTRTRMTTRRTRRTRTARAKTSPTRTSRTRSARISTT